MFSYIYVYLAIILRGRDGYEMIHTTKRFGKGACRARFTGIKIENSRSTGIKTDFSRIMHNSAFGELFVRCSSSFFAADLFLPGFPFSLADLTVADGSLAAPTSSKFHWRLGLGLGFCFRVRVLF